MIPLFGFYLQPSVGGRLLSYDFWRGFCEIDGVAAIKVAPFNRYQTLDVARGVLDSGRAAQIALYTGNDDNIIPDLLAEIRLAGGSISFRGGLLGQWAVWTRCAVQLLEAIQACRVANGSGSAAGDVFRDSGRFGGADGRERRCSTFATACRLHCRTARILRRQGLLAGRWCLDPAEDLSPGQLEEIDRYPPVTRGLRTMTLSASTWIIG